MSDNEKKGRLSEEEYQLPDDDEYIVAEAQPEPKTQENQATDTPSDTTKEPAYKAILAKVMSKVPKSRNGRILLVIGIVIVFALLIRLISADKDDVVPVAKQTAQPAVVQQQASVPASSGQQNGQMLGSLNALQAHSSQVKTEMENMKSQISDLKNSLDQSKSQNQQVEKAILALSDEVKALNVRLNQTVARFGSSKRPGSGVTYHLRAVLPDRAWIVSNTGRTLTVTIGDTINHYGVVQSIDPEQGIIGTSSGRKIYYGSNDF